LTSRWPLGPIEYRGASRYLNRVVPARRTRRFAIQLHTGGATAVNRVTLHCAAALP